jgi:hypothetical protein
VPVDAGVIFAYKKSHVDIKYNVTIFNEDPSITQISSYLTGCDIEFDKGDILVLDYANPSDLDVGIEAIFTEAE